MHVVLLTKNVLIRICSKGGTLGRGHTIIFQFGFHPSQELISHLINITIYKKFIIILIQSIQRIKIGQS